MRKLVRNWFAAMIHDEAEFLNSLTMEERLMLDSFKVRNNLGF